MSEPAYVRVIGPVIAQMDQLEALLTELLGTMRKMQSVTVEAPQPVVVPAPQVNVPPVDLTDLLAAIRALNIELPPDRTDEIIEALKKATGGATFAGGGTPKNLKTRDFYSGGEFIASITGDDTATLVRFKQADVVWVTADGGPVYVDPFGGDATTDAIKVRDGEWMPISVRTDRVSFYTPTGSTARGYTLRYDR